MKAFIGGVALAGFLATSATAQPLAPSTPINPAGMTGEDVVAWLQGAGYQASLSTDNEGDPLVQSAAQGIDFAILFYDCANGRCASLQFYSKFNMKTPTTAALMNQWNDSHRFLKAYVDASGNANITYDVDVDGGRAIGQLNEDFENWTKIVAQFPAFIGW